jgi:hypothetical protein
MKRSFIFPTILLLFGPACSTVSQQTAPRCLLQFVRNQIVHANLDRLEQVFHYIYTDPQSVKLDSVLADYELYLDGKQAAVGRGVSLDVSKDQPTPLAVPVRVNWLEYFGTLDKLVQCVQSGKKNAPFHMRTIMTFHCAARSFQLVCETEGQLLLPQIPPYIRIEL